MKWSHGEGMDLQVEEGQAGVFVKEQGVAVVAVEAVLVFPVGEAHWTVLEAVETDASPWNLTACLCTLQVGSVAWFGFICEFVAVMVV